MKIRKEERQKGSERGRPKIVSKVERVKIGKNGEGKRGRK